MKFEGHWKGAGSPSEFLNFSINGIEHSLVDYKQILLAIRKFYWDNGVREYLMDREEYEIIVAVCLLAFT